MRSQRRLQLKKIFPEVKSLYGGGNVKLIVDCFWFCNIILVKFVILKHRRMSYSYDLLLLFYPGIFVAIAEISQECFNLWNVKMQSIFGWLHLSLQPLKGVEIRIYQSEFLLKFIQIKWKLLVVDDMHKVHSDSGWMVVWVGKVLFHELVISHLSVDNYIVLFVKWILFSKS